MHKFESKIMPDYKNSSFEGLLFKTIKHTHLTLRFYKYFCEYPASGFLMMSKLFSIIFPFYYA